MKIDDEPFLRRENVVNALTDRKFDLFTLDDNEIILSRI